MKNEELKALKEILLMLVCDRCHYTYEIEDQAVLDAICDDCPLNVLEQMLPDGAFQKEIRVPEEILAMMGGGTA